MAFSISRRKRSGRVTFSIWRNGIWMTRLAVVLGMLVVVFACIDMQLLLTPVAEAFGAASLLGAMAGMGMCLYGVNHRSKRLRLRGFWGSLVGGTMLIAVVGLLYFRAYRSPHQAIVQPQLQPP